MTELLTVVALRVTLVLGPDPILVGLATYLGTGSALGSFLEVEVEVARVLPVCTSTLGTRDDARMISAASGRWDVRVLR